MLGWYFANQQVQADKKTKSLKGQLASVRPLVEDLKLKKEERMKQFADIKSQIEKISGEISGYGSTSSSMSVLTLEEQDLSMRILTEHQSKLRSLQKEKVREVVCKHTKSIFRISAYFVPVFILNYSLETYYGLFI